MKIKESKIGACINIFLKVRLFFHYYQNFSSSINNEEQLYLDTSETVSHTRKAFLWLTILELYKIVAKSTLQKTNLHETIKEFKTNCKTPELLSHNNLNLLFEKHTKIIELIKDIRNQIIAHSDQIESMRFLFSDEDIRSTEKLIRDIEKTLIVINNNSLNTQGIDKIAPSLKKFNLIKHATKGKKHS